MTIRRSNASLLALPACAAFALGALAASPLIAEPPPSTPQAAKPDDAKKAIEPGAQPDMKKVEEAIKKAVATAQGAGGDLPVLARKEVDGITMIQPTLAHMCNSGGVLHGGYMMSFADSAVTRAAGLTTGMAPSTVAFAAEFLAAGTPTAPLVTRVEVPRHGKSLAFMRGLLEQDGRKLLSYSATIKLRPRDR